jgi:bacillithiol system protein YtxJ
MILDLQQDLDLERLLDGSKTDPVLIFKHSTQCPISAEAYQEFTDFAEGAQGLICATVLVIENRKLSDAIAERFGVRHESPQALFILNGRVVWHASHWSITSASLRDALIKSGSESRRLHETTPWSQDLP